MSFILTRRWAIFFVLVVLGAWGAYLLGQWQFHRLQDTRATNHRTAANLAAAPMPVSDVMTVGGDVAAHAEWRRVTVHGSYDDAHAIVLKYQTRNGTAGVEVVTPLRTTSGSGPAVLVDRGWMQTPNTGGERPKLPTSVAGPVTVTGYVRVNGTGGAAQVADGETRAISSRTIAATLPYPVYGGFVDLASQAPRSMKALGATELPDDTSDGPHFFYGLQWWFFGVLAIFGFFVLMYDEFQRHRQNS